MSIGSAVAVFFVIWWTALFVVLPIGIRSQAEEGSVARGTDPGAPARPRLLRIVILNTVLSAIVFAAFLAVVEQDWITLDSFWFLPGPIQP